MQTFLAMHTFKDSTLVLDSKRLNKQRVECKQIYHAATGLREISPNFSVPAIGWKNHPATRMWRGYEHYLCVYALYICDACDARGINDHADLRSFFMERMLRHPDRIPPWWTNQETRERIVNTHRSNLVRKDKEFYGPLFPFAESDLDYYWPVQ